ncbi:hypothetical protein NQT74_10650 [Alteromonas stellipolaris]|uniref:hypothetical protein n=1 Tax=Alteromonas stellipolaris TaxID=233316 RepID=UPI002117CFE7|nr:hypothetical protein [Alteromonas stellipolaris]MCQ8849039.1 hypothetical protein [Alteromonas stellipolaris]
MNYRTDLKYDKGQLVVNNTSNADTRKKLPEVTLSDRLQSGAWGDSILKELAKYDKDSDPAINSAVSTHKQLVETAKKFVKRRTHQDPSVTQYAHLKRLNTDYAQALQAHEVSVKRAQVALIDTQINAISAFKDRLGFNDKHADEIRSRIYGLNPADRSQLLNQAVDNGDGNILSAVLDAHPMLTGLTNEQQTAYRSMAMNKHAPDLKAIEEQSDKLLSIISDSYADLVSAKDAMTGKAILDDYQREVDAANSL